MRDARRCDDRLRCVVKAASDTIAVKSGGGLSAGDSDQLGPPGTIRSKPPQRLKLMRKEYYVSTKCINPIHTSTLS